MLQTDVFSTARDSYFFQPTFEASETARLVKAVCSGFGLERQRAPPPPPLHVTGGTGGWIDPLYRTCHSSLVVSKKTRFLVKQW